MIYSVILNRFAYKISLSLDFILCIAHGNTRAYGFKHFNIVMSVTESNGFILRKAIMPKHSSNSIAFATVKRNNINGLIPPCSYL